MATAVKKLEGEVAEPVNTRIRITLTSTNVKNLEKVCADLKKAASDKHLKVRDLPFQIIFHWVEMST